MDLNQIKASIHIFRTRAREFVQAAQNCATDRCHEQELADIAPGERRQQT